MPTARATQSATANSEAFEGALSHVLTLEGGWSDDPFDPGGPTNKGITLADYARERRIAVTAENFAALKAELRSIPDRLVRNIYLTRYWRPARCPDLPPPLAFMHFDAAVNQGVSGAARMLQQAFGVDIDGEVGPITLAAARSRSLHASIVTYADIRRRRYRSLAHFWRFGRGWLRRVDATLTRSLASLPQSNPTQETKPMPDPQANFPNGIPTGASEVPGSKWWGQSLTIWGALLTALSTVLPLLGPILGINLTVDLVEKLGQDIVLLVQAAGGLIGTIMTILGRMRATTLLERRPVKLKL
jgi:lysozyme family protein